MSIYKFAPKNTLGEEVSLASYQGKVLLIVNTASKCGLTPQFAELEELYQKYGPDQFEILGFPCDQFANQELDDGQAAANFCQLNYGVTFPIFEKIDVNGQDAHPLFVYLKKEKSGLLGGKIKWNFTKFLVDHEGKVIKRYGPAISPMKFEKDIAKAIKKAEPK